MLIDARAADRLAVPADAVLVVGGGAAGMALTHDLARRGQRVVLLESGPDPRQGRAATAAGAAELSDGVVVGLPFQLHGRARALGGTTALWHGQCMKMHSIDLETRSWVAHSGWPLTIEDLEPHYGPAEEWLGVLGGDYGEARWGTHPQLVPFPWTADRLLHDFTEYTPEPHLLKRYGRSLVDHPLVHIVVNATVARVLLRDGDAVGVEVLAAGRSHALSASRVALAAGAIENARLLQLSDPAGVGLGSGRRHTGRFLQTHPVVNTARIVPVDYTAFTDRYIVLRQNSRRVFPKVRLAPAGQRQHQLLDATAVFLHEYDDPTFLAARRLLGALRERRRPERLGRDLATSLRHAGPHVRDLYRRYVRGMASRARPSSVYLQLWLEQEPDPESRLTLAEERDSLGLRRVRVQWKLGEPERRTSRVLTRWIAEDLARLGLARTEELPAMSDDAAWIEAVRDAAHPSGTTRMSTDSSAGVVDVDLQVHGVGGLYVVGSSVFPTAGYANPTLTIVALALRLSRHLSAVGAR